MKFNVNRSKGVVDMKRTRKSYGQNDRLTDRWTDGHTKDIPIIPTGFAANHRRAISNKAILYLVSGFCFGRKNWSGLLHIRSGYYILGQGHNNVSSAVFLTENSLSYCVSRSVVG